MSGAQTMQVECDRLLDEIDQIKSEKSELVKTIEENKTQLSQLSSQVRSRRAEWRYFELLVSLNNSW